MGTLNKNVPLQYDCPAEKIKAITDGISKTAILLFGAVSMLRDSPIHHNRLYSRYRQKPGYHRMITRL